MLNSKLIPILRDAVGTTVLLNGKLLPIEIIQGLCDASSSADQKQENYDHKIVYEVVRWRHGKPGWCDQHGQRMASSLLKFGYLKQQAEHDLSSWWLPHFRSCITKVATANNLTEQNIKLVVWRQQEEKIDLQQQPVAASEGTESNHSFAVVSENFSFPAEWNAAAFPIKSFYPPMEWYSESSEQGPSVAVMNALRTDPHSKVPMPELRARAVKMQQDFGCFEVLLKRPSDGAVTEGSRSNFLLIMKKQKTQQKQPDENESDGDVELVEALDEDVLMGITRSAIDRICQIKKISIAKRNVTMEDLLSERTIGMALTGTSLGCLPVRHLITFDHDEENDESKKIPKRRDFGKVPVILRELQQNYADYRDGVKEFPK